MMTDKLSTQVVFMKECQKICFQSLLDFWHYTPTQRVDPGVR